MDVDDESELPELLDTNAISAEPAPDSNANELKTKLARGKRGSRGKRLPNKTVPHAVKDITKPSGKRRNLDINNDVEMADSSADSDNKSTRRMQHKETDVRRIPVPPHRYTPLRENWLKLFQPVVEQLKLQMRFNLKTRCVEIRPSPRMVDISHLQKGADFIKAFTLGFEIDDALALIRLEDLFMESFDIQDVKTLKGDHLSRAIGRLAGKGGRTKFTIENATKTRIILADQKIHLLGSFNNIKVARNSICSLILGSPPSKVYGQMRSVSKRINERL